MSLLLQALDSILTASARSGSQRIFECLRLLFRKRTRRFDRPGLLVSAVDAAVPGTAEALAQVMFRFARLPFRYLSMNVFSHGSGDTVFALRSLSGQLVVKVQRESLGKPLADLLRLVWARRDAFVEVSKDYPDFDYFPPTHFAIVHGPLLGRPAVVSVQPFIRGEKRDILYGISNEELAELLIANDDLFMSLEYFVEQTSHSLGRKKWAIDLGRNNLLLVTTADETRLVYADTEMLPLDFLKETGRYEEHRRILARMKRVLNEVKAMRSVAA